MGRKRCWFGFVKRLFIPKPKSEEERRWRWVIGKLKIKRYAAISAPQMTLIEAATEEQRKHAVAVALATAAAAEAAVAAAHAAAEVVRLTNIPQEIHARSRDFAAVKIQSALRGHLARKALRALKGVVRLQAVVRGEITRRLVKNRLKCLPSTAKTHPLVDNQMRVPFLDGSCKDGAKKQLSGESEEKLPNIECKSDRSWDYSIFSREDIQALWLKRQEALAKRDRMKKYSFSHRERTTCQPLEGSNMNKENGREFHRLEVEQFAEIERCRRDSNMVSDYGHGGATQPITLRKHDPVEELNLKLSLPRRSFCRSEQKTSTGDGGSLPNSPVFPAYMAATESAKAKLRSMSTPKQRLGLLDAVSGHGLPQKPRLSSWSSFNGEMISTYGKKSSSSCSRLT